MTLLTAFLLSLCILTALCFFCTFVYCLWKYQTYCYRLYYPKNNVDMRRTRSIGYKKLEFRVGFDAITTAYLIPPMEGEPRAVVLYLHGNHSNILDDSRFVEKIANELTILFVYVDYRGYAGNAGLPTQEGVIEDSARVLDWIQNHEEFKNLPLVLCGMSLGAGIALHLLKYGKGLIKGVIVINCFTKLEAVVKQRLPRVLWCLLCFLKEKWDNIKKVRNTDYVGDVPALFLSSTNDNHLSPTMMIDLFNAYACDPDDKKFINIDGGHNAFFKTPSRRTLVIKVIREFLDVVCEPDEEEDSI